MAIKSFLSEGGFSVGSVGATPVEVIDSSGNITAGTISGSNLTLSGNLVVNGSTTTINSTTLTADDVILTLGGDTAPALDDNKDRGIEFRWHNGTQAKVGFFGFDDSAGKFVFVPDATNSSEVFSGTVGAIDLSGSLSAGSGIGFNGGTGQISNTGVLSITGTSNQVTASASTGAITLSLPQNIDTGANTQFGTVSANTFYLKNNANNYIQEAYGIRLVGASSLHPSQFNTSVLVGYTAAGADFGTGNVYASGRVSIGANTLSGISNNAKLLITGGDGIIVAGTANATYGSGIKFRNDGYEHFTIGAKGSGFVIAKTGNDGNSVWQTTPADVFNIDNAGAVSITSSLTTTSGGFIANGADPGFTVKASSSIGRIWFQKTAATAQTWQLGTSGNDATSVAFNIDDYTSGATKLKIGIGANGAFTFNAGTGGYTFNGTGTATVGGSLTVGSALSTSTANVIIEGADNYLSGLVLRNTGSYTSKIVHFADGTAPTTGSAVQIKVANDSSGNNVAVMTLKGSGYVGIGTTTPAGALDVVHGTTTPIYFRRENNDNQNIQFVQDPGGGWIKQGGTIAKPFNIGNFTASDTSIYSNSIERIRILSGGNVGIGTISPGYSLHVYKAGEAAIALEATRKWGLVTNTSWANNGLSFYDLTGDSSRMFIGTNGRVGISNNSPAHTLDVSGAINTSDWLYVQNNNFGVFNTANSMYFASNSATAWNISSASGQTAAGLRLYSGGNATTFRGWFYGDSDGQGFLDSAGSWALNLDGSKRLKVYAGVYNGDSGIRVVMPGGAAYSTTTSTVTGAFKIKLPTARYKSDSMLRMTVKIYQYSTGQSLTFNIGGYNYNHATNTWINVFAEQESDSNATTYTVRFGDDGTSNCIWIGETNTVWAYPQVFVSELEAGYSGTTSAWASGWSIAPVTTFDTVFASRTPAVKLTTNNVGTYGVSSITGTANQVVASASTGAVTLSLPQNIHTGATPTFAGGTLNGTLTIVKSNGGNVNGSANAAIYLSQDESSIQGPGTNTVIRMGGNLVLGANSTWIAATAGTAALTINNSQNSTFAGNITVSGGGVNSFTGTISVAGVGKAIDLVPSAAASPLYISFNQTVNSGGKLWRLGHTGAKAGYATFDIYNQTDNVTPFSTTSAGDTSILGNLTVSGGTGTIDATSGTASASLNLVGRSAGAARTATIASNSSGSLVFSAEGAGNAMTLNSSTGNLTVAYNLTVSGTTSTFGGTAANNSITVSRITTGPSSVALQAFTNAPAISSTSDTASGYTWNRLISNGSEIVRVHDANLTAISAVAGSGISVSGGIIAATNITAGASSKINWTGRAQLESPSNGIVKISSDAGSYPGYLNVAGIQSWDGVIALSVGTGTGHLTANANLTVTGNLIVNGTTTTVDSTVATIKDPIITLGGGNAGTAASSDDNKDRGIEFKWHNGTAAKTGFFGFDDWWYVVWQGDVGYKYAKPEANSGYL